MHDVRQLPPTCASIWGRTRRGHKQQAQGCDNVRSVGVTVNAHARSARPLFLAIDDSPASLLVLSLDAMKPPSLPSLTTTPVDPALILELASEATFKYCVASVTALFIYYYITTLDEGFRQYAKRKVTLATLLYIANRYIPLAYTFYNAPLFAASSNEARLV
ncbi:hypothetical protein C8Q73DRAFT_708386 [Cubamyces lactineus]|nr:hypothetical protein C8Q73DRAFT_708386 [Cubamyces lactineus]